MAPVEEQRHGAHLLAVQRWVDLEDARRRTALDLVLQARPRAARELAIGARAELEVLVDEVQRAPRAVAEWYGPK